MTQEELNYIKDSFSQILDDIGGNPDWYDAAKAVASDLGTIEKQLEERVTILPSNIDEAANNYGVDIRLGYPRVMDETDRYIYNAFKAGAEWLAGQGETVSGIITKVGDKLDVETTEYLIPEESEFERCDKVIVQIRKK